MQEVSRAANAINPNRSPQRTVQKTNNRDDSQDVKKNIPKKIDRKYRVSGQNWNAQEIQKASFYAPTHFRTSSVGSPIRRQLNSEFESTGFKKISKKNYIIALEGLVNAERKKRIQSEARSPSPPKLN